MYLAKKVEEFNNKYFNALKKMKLKKAPEYAKTSYTHVFKEILL